MPVITAYRVSCNMSSNAQGGTGSAIYWGGYRGYWAGHLAVGLCDRALIGLGLDLQRRPACPALNAQTCDATCLSKHLTSTDCCENSACSVQSSPGGSKCLRECLACGCMPGLHAHARWRAAYADNTRPNRRVGACLKYGRVTSAAASARRCARSTCACGTPASPSGAFAALVEALTALSTPRAAPYLPLLCARLMLHGAAARAWRQPAGCGASRESWPQRLPEQLQAGTPVCESPVVCESLLGWMRACKTPSRFVARLLQRKHC